MWGEDRAAVGSGPGRGGVRTGQRWGVDWAAVGCGPRAKSPSSKGSSTSACASPRYVTLR